MRVIHAIIPQVNKVWIVNNGSVDDIKDVILAQDYVEIIQNEVNLGIGSAIERAIEQADALGYEFLLTLDQDSIPSQDMVLLLREAYEKLTLKGIRVAGVGPLQIDRRSGHRKPFIAPINKFPPRRRKITPNSPCICEVDHLITSGLLVPISVYKSVGKPRADLFIDYVDIEWSLRARAHGFKLFAVGEAELHHSIGDDYALLFGKQIPVHKPLRHYYQFRNGVTLQKLKYIPIAWKISDAFQLIMKSVVFTLILPERKKRIRMILSGVMDGVRGKLGAKQES